MKFIIKYLIISFLICAGFSVLFYFSSLYPQFVKKKLSTKVFVQLKIFLEDSYLYENSNIDRLNVRFGGEIDVKLKPKATYNPNDTKKLFSEFIEKYVESVDTLPVIFYPLKKMKIKFFIDESEKKGYVFYFANGEVIDRYADIRESILKTDQEIAEENQEKIEQEQLDEKYKKLANKAFGFVNFGDSIDEVRLKFEEDPRVRINKVMVDNPTYEVILGSFKYKMTPVYKNRQLYLMNFVSDGFWPNQYKKELKQSWKDIIDFYTKIYGKTEDVFVEHSDIEEDYIKWTAEWNLNKKKIQVGLSRNNGLFYVVVWISHDDFKLE